MSAQLTFHDLIGRDLGQQDITWTERDAILYALACGAAADELDLVYERDLRPLPGLVAALGLWAVERCGALGVYDPQKSLHGSQSLIMRAPLAPSARLSTQGRIAAVWDKGKATVVEIEVCCAAFTASYTIFLPGTGGWGGQSGPAVTRAGAHSLAEVARYRTSPEQAVLYRLTGDLHPVHVDPEVARSYGFERPILHGLCTLGVALRLLGKAFGHHPAGLVAASARLSAPVLPGDCLTLRATPHADGYAFDVAVDERQVLKDGFASFVAPVERTGK